MSRSTLAAVAWFMMLLTAACHHHDHPHDDHDHDHDHDHPTSAVADVVTTHIAIPQNVRRSLGITFAKAENRAVARTTRLACRVDTAPDGHFPFHANVPGTATVHVRPHQAVQRDELLVSVVSPQLLEHRHELHTAADGVGAARDVLNVARAKLSRAVAATKHARRRLNRIRAAGASKAQLEAALSSLEGDVRVLRAERTAAERGLLRSEHRFEAELASFAARVGLSVKALQEGDTTSADHGDIPPRWETLTRLEFRAPRDGIISELPVRNGSWVEQGARVVEVRDPTALWVTCRALPSDLQQLRSGMRVSVVPAARPNIAQSATQGVLSVGLSEHDDRKTVPATVTLSAIPSWMRAGIRVFAEVVVDGTESAVTAVPSAALLRDGLETVMFRRDPANPDQAIRVIPELGPSDGRWTAVYSNIAPGDEVVVDGAYELKLASTAKPKAAGHFHADGTFHEGED